MSPHARLLFGWSSVIVLAQDGKFHFHAPIGAIVSFIRVCYTIYRCRVSLFPSVTINSEIIAFATGKWKVFYLISLLYCSNVELCNTSLISSQYS